MLGSHCFSLSGAYHSLKEYANRPQNCIILPNEQGYWLAGSRKSAYHRLTYLRLVFHPLAVMGSFCTAFAIFAKWGTGFVKYPGDDGAVLRGWVSISAVL